MTPIDLAEALKVATGPDPHLDNALYAAVRGLTWIEEPRGFRSGIIRWYDGSPTGVTSVSAYTGSVDTAMTLLPGHISYELTFSAAGGSALRRARLWDWRRSPPAFDPGNDWTGVAATLPLALCLAILHHHIATEGR